MKTQPRSIFFLLGLLLCAIMVAACSQAAPATDALESTDPEPPTESEAEGTASDAALNEATFTAVEYSFEGPESIPAGWTRLTLDNQGELPHDLMPLKLGEGKTMDDVMAALEAEGPPDWASFYGQVAAEPGEQASYLVNLTPGNYILLSFGSDEEGPPDAAQGMISALTVTEATTSVPDRALPEADAAVEMDDFVFKVEGTLQQGEQLVRLSNTGTELHEMIVVRLHEGTSFEDIRTLLESEEEPEGEPLVDDIGFALLSPGVDSYITLNLPESGDYVMICWIPSPAHEGAPHHELGMIHEFSIP